MSMALSGNEQVYGWMKKSLFKKATKQRGDEGLQGVEDTPEDVSTLKSPCHFPDIAPGP